MRTLTSPSIESPLCMESRLERESGSDGVPNAIGVEEACPREPLGAILFAVLGSGAARSPERFASGDAPPICPTTGVFRPHAKICQFRAQGSHRGSVLGRDIAGALDQPRLRRQGNQPATRTSDCRGPHFGRKLTLRRILPGIASARPLSRTPAEAA